MKEKIENIFCLFLKEISNCHHQKTYQSQTYKSKNILNIQYSCQMYASRHISFEIFCFVPIFEGFSKVIAQNIVFPRSSLFITVSALYLFTLQQPLYVSSFSGTALSRAAKEDVCSLRNCLAHYFDMLHKLADQQLKKKSLLSDIVCPLLLQPLTFVSCRQ